MVIAKTLDGDIGVLTGHPPVLGILAEGSVVGSSTRGRRRGRPEVLAAVSSGFLSVRDDRVSILAAAGRARQRGGPRGRAAELDAALGARPAPAAEEPAEVKYSRALLRAAGDRS